jgi:hypothetical protein
MTFNIPSDPQERALLFKRNAELRVKLHELLKNVGEQPSAEVCCKVSALLKQGRADGIYPLP